VLDFSNKGIAVDCTVVLTIANPTASLHARVSRHR
jgi:hypothetical protein